MNKRTPYARKVLKEQLEEKDITQGMKCMVPISFRRSAYVSRIRTRTGQHVTIDNEVEVPDTKDQYIQKVFAIDNFYGTGTPRFETVMLKVGATCRKGMEYNKVWFGNALRLLSVKYKKKLRKTSDVGMAQNKDNFEICTVKIYEKVVFVQYYDIIGEDEVPNDKVDEYLDCIRLKW